MDKLLFVINPISGDLDKADLQAQVSQFCLECSLSAVFYQTTGQNDRQAIQSLLTLEQPKAVVAAGGDGTVNLVGTLLTGTTTPLGILPLGSGNGLAKDLHIPQGFEEALAVINQGKIRPMDTLQINGMPSLHLSDLGFNALVVERFTEANTRGPGTYAWNVAREYLGYEPKAYEIITDKEHYKGKAFMVTIANANMFGSNATINPEGEVDDGRFEICILEEFPKLEGIRILYQLYRSDITQSPYNRVLTCKRAVIHNPERELVQIDGEPAGTPDQLTVSILPQSLKVLLP